MKFRIVWQTEALHDIMRIWADANLIERSEIRGAIEDLRNALQMEPTDIGESRSGSRRIVFRWPLWATFDVDVDRGIV